MIGQYRVNGHDLYILTGFIADSARITSNSIEKPHDPKQAYRYDFNDGEGTQWDFVTPIKDEPRTFRIDGHLYATSEADYHTKREALLTLLKSGLLTIYASHIEKTVSAKFKSFPTWERLTKIKGANKIFAKIAIELDEVIGEELPTYSLFYGGTNAIPTTEVQVKGLPVSGPTEMTFTVNTGLNRIVVVAIPITMSIKTIRDLQSHEYLYQDTRQNNSYRQRSLITIDGTDYKIIVLENGLAYSYNHEHIVTLKS